MELQRVKTILIFPPVWQPTAPYLAIPSLLGQLLANNYDAQAIDLNAEFYNDILRKSYIEKSIELIKKTEQSIKIKAKDYDIKKIFEYPIETRELILKNRRIRSFLKKKPDLLDSVPKKIEKSVKNLKNKKEFYNPDILLGAIKDIEAALEIISLPYAPSKLMFDGFNNPLLKYDYESIKYHVFKSESNMFKDYYKKWIHKIKKQKPKLIGISIASYTQLIAGLTLANMLKEETDAHICIGGNHFSRIADNLKNNPDFFDIFADSLLVDEGEKAIIDLAKYINNEIDIENVPNLIYKKGDKVISNPCGAYLELNKYAAPDFKGFDFSKYITPEIVIPIQATKGCFWGKCSFCDIPYGKKYNTKDIDILIKEIKYYKKHYKINNFCIIDESIMPAYFEKLADKIIESKLNINYFGTARTDKNFTPEIFSKLRKSGFRMAMWGIESNSDRILTLINKGVDINGRVNIVKDAADANIWNKALAFVDFPTETFEEAEETVNFITSNIDIFHSCSIGSFLLGNHSEIHKNHEKYGIKKISYEQDFSTFLYFEEENRSQETVKQKRKMIIDAIIKNYGNALWRFCKSYNYMFLYITKHGVDWMQNFKYNDSDLE